MKIKAKVKLYFLLHKREREVMDDGGKIYEGPAWEIMRASYRTKTRCSSRSTSDCRQDPLKAGKS